VYLLQEISSQSGFLDLTILTFLKSLIQKAINNDKNAVKLEQVEWMVYFLSSVFAIEGISIRNLLKSIFEQWYQHLVDKPTLLKNENAKVILRLFTLVLCKITSSFEDDADKSRVKCKV
jgi:hypothetical protein